MAHKTIALTTELRELETHQGKNKLEGAPVTKSPWPNGQGVGLLIRRLWARVPQGMSLTAHNDMTGSTSRSMSTIRPHSKLPSLKFHSRFSTYGFALLYQGPVA